MPLLWVVGIVLVVLKLASVIAWSWWIVTLPLWIGFALILVGLIFGTAILGSVATIMSVTDRRSRRR